ncbi:MAG: TetR/AcrR family transcriptional regulator [Clostridia bacterium]|nr:TetR/AcrR family transcriptional regulator [Clostridia bacterium]
MARKHEQERNEAIKKLIIDAALDICLKEGYKEITVRGIGERIGYSTGVIYYHFKDKQDIMDCVDRLLDEETYNTVFTLIDPTLPLSENLSVLYDYTCELAYNNVEAYKRVFTASRIEGNEYTRKMWLNMFEKCLSAAKDRGEVRCQNIGSLAKCLLGYIIGYNLLYFEIGRTTLEESMKEKDIAISAIVNGILSAE